MELVKEVLAIKTLMENLRGQDPNRLVFGSSSHEYQLGPTLSEKGVQDKDLGVRLRLTKTIELSKLLACPRLSASSATRYNAEVPQHQ
jgi:hypothetical protein